MLFNSYPFVFAFLPAALLLTFGARLRNVTAAAAAVIAASLFFYGWWHPQYLLLLLTSIAVNFLAGRAILSSCLDRRAVLIAGIAFNLGLLSYYKYANFFASNIEAVTGAHVGLAPIILPLAISFFTFEQISFLVDCYRGETRKIDFLRYLFFIVFFPHLIAGPIVRYANIAQQLDLPDALKPRWENFAAGGAIFIFGLFKKVGLADTFAGYANPVFDAAAGGEPLTFFAAWLGALAYSLQLYFDFSGYSDMAVGLARLFGITLPINFFSPYKATSIIEFWRRWHISLSQFLRDYLYVPLGGSHKGHYRTYANLFITMLMVGFWHGAGWTFVLWGTIHGVLLVINHAWRNSPATRLGFPVRFTRPISWLATFLCVVLAWVVFRAPTFESAGHLLSAMTGMHGIALPARLMSLAPWLTSIAGVQNETQFWLGPLGMEASLVVAVGMAITLALPNLPEMFAAYYNAVPTAQPPGRQWRFKRLEAVAVGIAAAWALTLLGKPHEFLYFNF
jgi:alginate O-acetyltransferase complex protein AlgI